MLENNLAGAMTQGLPGLSSISTDGQSARTEESLAGEVWGQFLRARTERLQRDYEWWVAWQWYNGDTSVFLDRSSNAGQIYRVTSRRPRHKRNLPLNLVGLSIDLLVAKQMRAEPVFDAAPVSRQKQGMRMAAREVRDLVRYLWDKNELKAERRPLFLDRNITGNGFCKVYFDENKAPFKDDIVKCSTCQGTGQAQPPPEVLAMAQQAVQQLGYAPPMPQMGPCPVCQGQGSINRGRVPVGDVAITPISPWEIWPVAGAKRIEHGCFHAFKLTIEEAAVRYGLPASEIQPSRILEKGESQFAQLARLHRIETKNDENSCWIVERWLPPAPRSETPRLTILVGNRIVWPKPESTQFASGSTTEGIPPYQRVPIFHFRLRPTAENFWSSGIVLDMVAANDFVNRARASFHRHQQTMAFTKWFFEEGSIDSDRLVAEEGEAVPYRGVNPPTQRAPASMPQFYVDLFKQEMDFIPQLAGLQEIDRGIAPPNIEAFQALHFLAEQSETVHGPVYIEDERQWRAMAWAALRCAMFKYKPLDQRILKVGGNGIEVKALFQADLSDCIDIRAEIGSALAHSPALRQEMVYRGIEVGAITPQQAVAKGLLDFGVVLGEDSDDHRNQEAVAAMENEQMAANQPHYIFTAAHDHQVHFEVHRRAALEAQMDGNMMLCQQLEAACEAHMQAMMAGMGPPAPPPGRGSKGGKPGKKPPAPPGAQPPGAPPVDGDPGAQQYGAPTGA